MEYKMLRLFAFFLASLLPVIITMFVGIASFLFLGQQNLVEIAIITFVSFLFAIIISAFIGFQMTGQNPFIKAIQGEAMLLFGYSSGGTGQIFTCVTQKNPSGGIDIVANINKQEVVLAYDKPMSYRILAPAKALLDLVHPKKVIKDGVEVIEKAKTIITIENEDFDKFAMRFGYLTILFYNFETGTLTNKFSVNELEKFYAMKYLSLHLDRKLDIYIAELRMARKNFFAALLNKITEFMKSPVFPILVIVIIGFFAIVIIMYLFPGIGGFFTNLFPHAPVADTNAIPPITHGAITPIPQTH